MLFRAIPRRDVKPLAKALIAAIRLVRRSASRRRVQRLAEVEGLGDAGVTEFKIVEAAAQRFAAGAVEQAAGARLVVAR